MLENKINYIFGLILITIFLIITSNNIKSIFNYTKGLNNIKQSEAKLEILEDRNMELKEKITTTESDEYIQKLAVEELNLAAENTTILIIPEENNPKIDAPRESYSNQSGTKNFSKWIRFLNLR